MRNKQLNIFIALIIINFIVFFIALFFIGVFQTQLFIISGAYVALLLTGILFYYSILEHQKKKMAQTTMTIQGLEKDIYSDLKIGVLLFDANNYVVWCNKFIAKSLNIDVNSRIDKIGSEFYNYFKNENKNFRIENNGEFFKVIVDAFQKIIYFENITELVKTETAMNYIMEDKKKLSVVIMFFAIDNYDDIMEKIDERKRNEVDDTIRNLIEEWSSYFKAYSKRYQANRFLILINHENYENIIADRFSILDRVRNSFDLKTQITISIGVGKDEKYILENISKASSALELAQNRGGDQVVIKNFEKTEYLGGVKEAKAKSNRVLVRQVTNNLEKTIREAKNVIIMGHRQYDFDCLGASLVIGLIAAKFGKEVYITKDQEIEKTVAKLLVRDKELNTLFYSEEEIRAVIDENSLLVIVDIAIPSLVVFPNLLEKIPKKIVFDHHRRTEYFIASEMAYIEPYASSTSELVVEMLDFLSEEIEIDEKNATYILAGITVDTKNFTFRTGRRTFEAAAKLKKHGADSLEVQSILKENIEDFLISAKSIKNTEVFLDNIGIVIIDQILDTTELSKIADKLLSFENIEASFVIGAVDEDTVKISSRSLGDINCQKIMEQLGGGGHLTNAATVIKNKNMKEVISLLKEVILSERI